MPAGKVLPTLAVVGEAAIYKVPLDGGSPVQAILNHTVLTGVNGKTSQIMQSDTQIINQSMT